LSSRIAVGPAAQYQLNELSSNFLIAEMCLSYLIHLGDTYRVHSQITDRLYDLFPLLHYAVTFWGEHLRRLQQKPRSDRLDQLSLQFLNGSSTSWQFWLHFVNFQQAKQTYHEKMGAEIAEIYAAEAGTFTETYKHKRQEIQNDGVIALDPLSWISACPLNDQIQLYLDNNINTKHSHEENFLGTPLYAAVSFGNYSTAKVFLTRGMSVNNSRGPRGTALHVASYHGYLNLVQLCVESGADINMSCEVLGTPLANAAFHGRSQVLSYLLEKGADPNYPNPPGDRLLNSLILQERSVTILKFLKHGADIEASGVFHSSPLQEAAEYGKEYIVWLLLQHGANPNSGGGSYGGPLEAAAWAGHTNIVRILLEHGADVNGEGPCKNSEKYKSPLAHAVYQTRPDVAKLLLKFGACIGPQNKIYTSLRKRIYDLEAQVLAQQRPDHWLLERSKRNKAVLSILDDWFASQGTSPKLENT